ncbi:hypothetical protein Tco_1385726 [Tanacetum coccineum]
MQSRRLYFTNDNHYDSLSSSNIPPPPAPVCPCRKARLLQPYKPEPFMQPFRYHPNGMTFIHTARKRVRAPQAHIASSPVLPSPLVVPSSPLSHPKDSIGENSQTVAARQPTILTLMMRLERHEEHIDTILNHLDEFPLERIEQIEYGIEDELSLERIEKMKDNIEGLGNGRRKQMGHDDEIILARIRISTLEMLIEDIQIRHRSDMKNLLDMIHELKNHKGGPPDY